MKNIISKIDALPFKVLFIGNVVISTFVLVAHGGWLLISSMLPPEEIGSKVIVATITLPTAGLILLSSLLSLWSARIQLNVLRAQSLILAVGVIFSIMWFVSFPDQPMPKGGRLSIGIPGMLSAITAYVVYLVRRSWLRNLIEKNFIVRYSHVFAFCIIFPIETYTVARLALSFFRQAT